MVLQMVEAVFMLLGAIQVPLMVMELMIAQAMGHIDQTQVVL